MDQLFEFNFNLITKSFKITIKLFLQMKFAAVCSHRKFVSVPFSLNFCF